MAGCYAREMDDLHWWLPPEIFADIGIVDAPPAAAAGARRRLPAVEDVAVHLAGILGGSGKVAPRAAPPAGAASCYRYHHAQVCGREGRVLVAYGGNGVGAAVWPFLPPPPPPVQWQVANSFVKGGGVLDPRFALAPVRPCRGSPPLKRRGGGTGVFLPRAEVYQTRVEKDGKTPKERLEQQQQQQRVVAAMGRKQCQHEMAAQMLLLQQQNANAALHACPELALPQEWTY